MRQTSDGETDRYSELLNSASIDLAFVGFGENGHIAFNDPHVADFNNETVKRVSLDEACRKQQAGEGHFKNVESVPKEALQSQPWIVSRQSLGVLRAGEPEG